MAPALRRLKPFVTGCASISAPLPEAWLLACASVTTKAASTCPPSSRTSSRSWVPRAPRRLQGTGGQGLRRAVHPHAEGEPALGAKLRHRRAAASDAAGLPASLQHHLPYPAARISDTRPTSPAFTCGTRCLQSFIVSHQPGPVHWTARNGRTGWAKPIRYTKRRLRASCRRFHWRIASPSAISLN